MGAGAFLGAALGELDEESGGEAAEELADGFVGVAGDEFVF